MNLLPPFLIIYKLLLYKISYQLSLPLVFETFVVAPWLKGSVFSLVGIGVDFSAFHIGDPQVGELGLQEGCYKFHAVPFRTDVP